MTHRETSHVNRELFKHEDDLAGQQHSEIGV